MTKTSNVIRISGKKKGKTILRQSLQVADSLIATNTAVSLKWLDWFSVLLCRSFNFYKKKLVAIC